jgi:pyruvate,orthophosphate dikinase
MHAAQGHPHGARRHDQPRGRRRARHGQALRRGAARCAIDAARTITVGPSLLKKGDIITLDGGTGEVYEGACRPCSPSCPAISELMGWADKVRR